MSKIAVVMMQKDEGSLLQTWLAFHEHVFGSDAIYVLDNLSSDLQTLFYLSEAQKRGVHVRYGVENFEQKGVLVSQMIGELTASYSYVVPLDCDEFVGVLSDNKFMSTYQNIFNELERASGGKECYVRVPHAIWNIPFTTGGYMQALQKIVVSRMRAPTLDLGFHLYDFYENKPTVPADTVLASEICYLHFHNGPFERVIASARRKLQKRISTYSEEEFNNYRGAGKHLMQYFMMTELQYMKRFPPASHDLGKIFADHNCIMPFSTRTQSWS